MPDMAIAIVSAGLVATIDDTAALIVGLLGVILGPLVAYVVASRKLSGKIATSEAADLWAESSRLREDYRKQLARSEQRVTQLQARVDEQDERIEALETENRELHQLVVELTATQEG